VIGPILITVIRESPPVLGECRSCKAPIEWVTTGKSVRMPVDSPLVVEATFARDDGRTTVSIDARRSHFVNCPDAAAFRRRKGSRR
jgi:hypothetical protein